MNFLEERIRKEAIILSHKVLKVDSFINHQIDVEMTRKIAAEMKHRFVNEEITKILTIEASGIAIAVVLAEMLGNIPVVFAKKSPAVNNSDDRYVHRAFSFTHQQHFDIYVSKPFLHSDDKLLIVDDFLADGQAMTAMINIAHQAGAEVAGLTVAVEKGFQPGGD